MNKEFWIVFLSFLIVFIAVISSYCFRSKYKVFGYIPVEKKINDLELRIERLEWATID